MRTFRKFSGMHDPESDYFVVQYPHRVWWDMGFYMCDEIEFPHQFLYAGRDEKIYRDELPNPRPPRITENPKEQLIYDRMLGLLWHMGFNALRNGDTKTLLKKVMLDEI